MRLCPHAQAFSVFTSRSDCFNATTAKDWSVTGWRGNFRRNHQIWINVICLACIFWDLVCLKIFHCSITAAMASLHRALESCWPPIQGLGTNRSLSQWKTNRAKDSEKTNMVKSVGKANATAYWNRSHHEMPHIEVVHGQIRHETQCQTSFVSYVFCCCVLPQKFIITLWKPNWCNEFDFSQCKEHAKKDEAIQDEICWFHGKANTCANTKPAKGCLGALQIVLLHLTSF